MWTNSIGGSSGDVLRLSAEEHTTEEGERSREGGIFINVLGSGDDEASVTEGSLHSYFFSKKRLTLTQREVLSFLVKCLEKDRILCLTW